MQQTPPPHTTFAERYERDLVGPLFRPFAEALLVRANPPSRGRLLDVACGTGIVARLAQQQWPGLTDILGIDINPEMLAVAQAAAPSIRWRRGSAVELPLADGEAFDVVTCHQGLQFFPDRTAALAQMRQAIAPGGRLAISCWQSDEDMPVLRALRGLAERHLGPVNDRRYCLGDPAQLGALVREAGFAEVELETVTRPVRFDDARPFLRLNAMAMLDMSEVAPALPPDARAGMVETIISDSAAVLQDQDADGGLAFDLATYQVIAAR